MLNSDKKGKLLTGMLIIVIIGIVCIIGYFGYKIITEDTKVKEVEEAVAEFDDIYIKPNQNDTEPTEENGTETGDSEGTEGSNNNGSSYSGGSGSQKAYIQGYEIIAKIRIPAISLEYPVLEDISKKALDTAICKLYSTSDINEIGNTVFIGHNYRNRLFFSRVDQLKTGDKVYITDTYGREIEYVIYQIFEATSTDTSFYQRDTEGKREITLSTCTDDASTTDKRLIVFARENS